MRVETVPEYLARGGTVYRARMGESCEDHGNRAPMGWAAWTALAARRMERKSVGKQMQRIRAAKEIQERRCDKCGEMFLVSVREMKVHAVTCGAGAAKEKAR